MTLHHSSWPQITLYGLKSPFIVSYHSSRSYQRIVKDASILLDSSHRPWAQELASIRTTSLPQSARNCVFLYLNETRKLSFPGFIASEHLCFCP
ncbi:hypothetical protein CCUS01_04143 [Colletotrichum cuscutae]|uniref:Uncharacterized protein n=1 Tax=Colletotrichum cuscutae TaxID=1209917 RepID=A0AAI9VG33_9PEZI|nr:hypothetical protein CCUS01_04143 [Colletotrichum cuscutae]